VLLTYLLTYLHTLEQCFAGHPWKVVTKQLKMKEKEIKRQGFCRTGPLGTVVVGVSETLRH